MTQLLRYLQQPEGVRFKRKAKVARMTLEDSARLRFHDHTEAFIAEFIRIDFVMGG